MGCCSGLSGRFSPGLQVGYLLDILQLLEDSVGEASRARLGFCREGVLFDIFPAFQNRFWDWLGFDPGVY